MAHTPLVNTLMPSNAHYFLTKYLDILRLNIGSVNQKMESKFNLERFDSEDDFYNKILFDCGYSHLYVHNLAIVIILGLVLAAIWCLCALKDYIIKSAKCPSFFGFMKIRHEPMICNIALRFFYELFLEICICLMINITFVKFESF